MNSRSLGIFVGVFTLFGFGSEFHTFAGLPEQDPAIKNIQQKFEKGSVPGFAEIHLGDIWVCTTYGAQAKDKNKKVGPLPKYQFSEQGGFIYAGDLLHPSGQRASGIENFVFSEKGLSGMNSQGEVGYLRSTDQGLIVEFVAFETPENGKSSPAVSDTAHVVSAYVYCPLDQLIRVAPKNDRKGIFSFLFKTKKEGRYRALN